MSTRLRRSDWFVMEWGGTELLEGGSVSDGDKGNVKDTQSLWRDNGCGSDERTKGQALDIPEVDLRPSPLNASPPFGSCCDTYRKENDAVITSFPFLHL